MPGEQPAPGQAAYEAVESPNKPRPADPLARSVADTLRRIEANYEREGSGPGSRFEGQLLEDVQALAVVKAVAAPLREEAASLRGQLERLRASFADLAGDYKKAGDIRAQLQDVITVTGRERDAARAGLGKARDLIGGVQHLISEYELEELRGTDPARRRAGERRLMQCCPMDTYDTDSAGDLRAVCTCGDGCQCHCTACNCPQPDDYDDQDWYYPAGGGDE